MAERDLRTPDDIRILVDAFYEKVGDDPLLGPVFNDVAQVDWTEHLPTMYRFWESMLLGSGTYTGNPFPKHSVLPVRQEHFERWVGLFAQTVDEHFRGLMAEEAKARAMCIADTFARRMGVVTEPAGLVPSV